MKIMKKNAGERIIDDKRYFIKKVHKYMLCTRKNFRKNEKKGNNFLCTANC